MKIRSWIPAALFVLFLGGTALAQSPGLVDRYRRHFAQLRQSDRVHLKTLMEQGAMALRVFDAHAIALPEKGKPAEKAPTDPKVRRALVDQLYTAAVELKDMADGMQRRPLPPDGFWIQYSQGVKIPAARMELFALDPDDPRIAFFISRAKVACYDCHRNYGGPLEDSGLLLTGKSTYDELETLPRGWAEQIAHPGKKP